MTREKYVYWRLFFISLAIAMAIYMVYYIINKYYLMPLHLKEPTKTIIKEENDSTDRINNPVQQSAPALNDSIFIANEIKRITDETYHYLIEIGYKDSTYQQRLDEIIWLYQKKGLTEKQNSTLNLLKNLLTTLPNKKPSK